VKLGNEAGSINKATYPTFNEAYLVSDSFSYPISFNGKVRIKVDLPSSMNAKEIEDHVMGMAELNKYLEGKQPKKLIVVPGRIVNIVV
jgi:leucyl-tRNA synthetase